MSSTDLSDTTAGDAKANGYVRPQIGNARRGFMLALFCIGQFMDSFLISALFPAQTFMEKDLDIHPNEITWVFSAYGATFAGFLLVSGRISDIFSSKWAFISGIQIIAFFSLGCGFVQDKVGLFILRALAGIGAALTIPGALSLIVEWFPEPHLQSQAIALFGTFGGIGACVGILIAGAFIQGTTWRWIFWFTCILLGPLGVAGIWLIPTGAPKPSRGWRGLDLGGVFLITSSTILFVYAVTSGSATGWGSANVIAPLIISIALGAAYFFLQARLGEDMASLPTKIWYYPNVAILIILALFPYSWWNVLYLEVYPRFEGVYGWSPIMSSVRVLWISLMAVVIGTTAAHFVKFMDPKYLLLIGFVIDFAGTMLLPFFDRADRYWSYFVPACIIGSGANMIIYVVANIAIFMNTPPEIAGTIGAVFNAAFQLGNALDLAIVTSIVTSQQAKLPPTADPNSYAPVAAGFWFLIALMVAEGLAVAIFYKPLTKLKPADVEASSELASRTSSDDNTKRGIPAPNVNEKL